MNDWTLPVAALAESIAKTMASGLNADPPPVEEASVDSASFALDPTPFGPIRVTVERTTSSPPDES